MKKQSPDLFPPGSWDTHVHIFDKERFPLAATRSYTPPAALASDLVEATKATNILLVQASIEHGSKGILTHLNNLTKADPARTVRAALVYDPNSAAEEWSDERIAELHKAGVRCLRYHAAFQDNFAILADEVCELLRGRLGAIAMKSGWAVSMQLPLQVWAKLGRSLQDGAAGMAIIAEHCASFNMPVSEKDKSAVDEIVRLVSDRILMVKVCALHRRASSGSENGVVEFVRRLAETAPEQLIWGSDWPHVNSAARGMAEAGFVEVDTDGELGLIQARLSSDAYDRLMCRNAQKLFS